MKKTLTRPWIHRHTFSRIFAIASLLFLSGLVSPAPSHAFVPDSLKTYVVWNQFDATVNTFQKIGLIMSDARYQELFAAVIVFGLIFGGIFTIGLGMLSGHHPLWGWFKWFGIIMIGVIVYLTFIKPTTQITIYDEALNETQTVGGIPEGIVLIAGLSNAIERGFVDMIWTAGSPQSYRENAGGLALSIYEKAFSGGLDLAGGDPNGQYINASLRRYIKDCVFFEMTRPGSTINVNDFNTTADFRTIFQNAQNPAIYTVWYDSANHGGLTVTCTQDWTVYLSPYLNGLVNASPAVTRFWEERCGEAGLGANSQVGGAVDLVSVCRQKAENMTTPLFGASFSSAHLFRQYLMAEALFDVYTEYSPESAVAALSSRAAGNSMIGMGIMANEWIPIIRSVVFSIFIGMIPFLCLLIPTPLFSRTMSLMFGIFIFLTVWTICDALIHSFAMDKMLDLFKEISDGSLGFKSMMLFSSSSAKALAAFGAARWSAIMLGGVFSSILVKFGGSALAHFAGNLAAFKQYGGRAAESANNPSKWASDLRGESQVMPSMVYANAGFRDVSAARAYDAESSLGTSLGGVGALGAGNPSLAAGSTARANVTGLKERVAHSGAVKSYAGEHGMTENQVISAIQNYKTASSGGSARALSNLADDLHTSAYGAMDFMKDVGMNREYGQARGLKDAYDNAVGKNGYTGSFPDYVGMQSELQSERGFADVKAVDKFSANYRDGRTAFLKDHAEFRTGQAEGMLNNLRNKRLDPGSIGEVLGALQGARNFIDSKVYSQFGDRGVEITREGEQYNELSKMGLRQAVNDIAETGRIQKDTLGILTELKNIREAAGQLRSQEASTSFGISPETAHQFGEYLRRQGSDVIDSELSGTTANVSWNVDRDGNLVPSMVVAKKGEKLAETDLHEQDFRRVQRGIKPTGGGWRGSFAGYDFISGERTDLGGGMVKIHGVTNDGKIIDLMGSTAEGKESIASEVVTQGPSYKGALVMAQQGKVPTKAFHNQADSAIFATEYSNGCSRGKNGYVSKLTEKGAIF